MYHTLAANSPLLDRTLDELGVPPWDVITGRAGDRQRSYEFADDRQRVLGPMASVSTAKMESPS
jgi:hypothetical protein